MEYTLAALALVATVVGIVGGTWRDRHPTTLGWVAGAVALLVCIISIVHQFNKQTEERKIASGAYINVLRSVHGLVVLRGNQDEGRASIWMRKRRRMRDGGRA